MLTCSQSQAHKVAVSDCSVAQTITLTITCQHATYSESLLLYCFRFFMECQFFLTQGMSLNQHGLWHLILEIAPVFQLFLHLFII